MKTLLNISLRAVAGFVVGVMIGNSLALLKLASLGLNPPNQVFRLSGLPMLKVQSSAQGFSASTGVGVVMLGVILAVILVGKYLVGRWIQSGEN